MTNTDNITFSTGTLIGFGAGGAMMILAALTYFFILRKKIKLNVKALIAGAVVFPVFALGLKNILQYPLLIADTPIAKAAADNIWLFYFIGAVCAGLFEETGRFIAFKTVLKNCRSREDSVSYGLGHGGFEAVYFGFSTISLVAMGLLVNNSGVDAVLKGAEGAARESAIEQVRGYAEQTLLSGLLGGFERIPAIALHIGLSMLVFAAARQKGKGGLFPLAIFLHALVDFVIAFYKEGCFGLAVFEVIFAVMSAAVLFGAYKLVYNKMDRNEV
ncbi:YhfC family glutamic-type intramembrane protease [Ruminococcus sp.]|uniref:YhfC family intramembrane metalloprotease n=1 Tax=Ruminococcus sp. TaxID=41978 RepID=UPI0025DCDB00|nr:YhfC family glutamic-type intramembrane protease [Ruminococcus sp.]MBQ8966542.1 YhfC family intramembrane metalloprotease [Ruminococcus sp.]